MQADISGHDSAKSMSWSHSLKPSASIAVVSCKLFSSQSPAPAIYGNTGCGVFKRGVKD